MPGSTPRSATTVDRSVRVRRSRLWRSRSAMIGGTIIGLIVLGAVCAPVLAPDAPEKMEMSLRLKGPSWEHPMGTDQFGRDLFTRIVYGARISLGVALIAVALS